MVLMVARLSDPIIPYPTGRFPFFAPIPGNKLPGYFHNVPTGQRHLTPVHEFEATSGRARRDLTTCARDTGRATIKSRAARSIEDEDEYEKIGAMGGFEFTNLII